MSIARPLQRYFNSGAQSRGFDYFSDGRVQIVKSGEFGASAIVRGSGHYVCTISSTSSRMLKNVVVSVSCNCRYFETSGPCKHLWALIAQLDSEDWGRSIGKAENVELDEEPSPILDDEDLREFLAEARRKPGASAQKPNGISHGLRTQNPDGISWESFRWQISHENKRLSVLFQEELIKPFEKERRLFYALDLGGRYGKDELLLRFFCREKLRPDRLGTFRGVKIHRRLDSSFDEPDDQLLLDELLTKMDGFVEENVRSQGTSVRPASAREAMQGLLLKSDRALEVLSRLRAEGKLFVLPEDGKKPDDNPLEIKTRPWSLAAELEDHAAEDYRLRVTISDGQRSLDPRTLSFLARGRFFVEGSTLHPTTLSEQQLQDWVETLARGASILVPRSDLNRFIAEYSQIPSAPMMTWPTASHWQEISDDPRPKLRLTVSHGPAEWMGELIFQYQMGDVNLVDTRSRWIDADEKRIYQRDFSREEFFLQDICQQKGIWRSSSPDMVEMGRVLRVAIKFLPSLVAYLEERGWDVEVENRRLHVLRDIETVVHGKTDWLDLAISTRLGEKSFELPSLLRRPKLHSHFIELGHGACAVLPEAWTERMRILEQTAEFHDGQMRFPARQALLLDSLLAGLEIDDRSEQFGIIRNKIKNFQALEPRDPSDRFQGTLRDYQKDGLAWLEFLRDFGFGGCLADDMGLGKTIQVLALLQSYHRDRTQPSSLIVLPRSLVDNWRDEAARFCPDLVVKDFSKGLRNWGKKDDADLILITYGTLRQDIEQLHKRSFGYVILDESQAIKNESSQTAKAAYLLKARHRLALSGTPIENHLGELRSLLRFLNPGLLDRGPWAKLLQKNSDLNDTHVTTLNKALKPLILRRNKSEVLKDLPPKLEYILHFELEGEQRRLYEELRDHYRRHLLPELQDDTWRKEPLNLIEALLRLRQAACHPALVSAAHSEITSAKVEILLDKLRELRESGHKALIFSQFTSFLKIIAAHMDDLDMPYEYLDGQTRDRSARVARFQNDPQLPFFLISLKAGGVGLNLTAADYCFILDPWWNPAVEAQAIDRVHRIHQTRTVFAYRLIAKDTVEEKIQLLQKEKRDMAASLLDQDQGLLQSLDLKAIQSLFS